ncbi:hypothetical protein UFOVP654_60 [uncultured Caudovirales phage]|uniref:Uncharacterized protein n=1 Tax=uncultured Caudovirales phage TaxID=2100421 RepID=A0A6J5N8D3_9CAUD|nr:hypothetical protein UFOVP654_60 [uncultured Caudovirales phage]
MRKSNHHAIRMLLQQYHDGLTVSEIVERTEKERRAIDKALLDMPDAYIDRWTSHRKQWTAVWCVVVPPQNCPKPTEKPIDRTRNQPTRLSSDVRASWIVNT